MRLIPYEWNDWPVATGLRHQMNRLLDTYFTGFGEERTMEWRPNIDVVETPETVVVKAELPGIEAKDIEISVVGDTLTIRGEKKFEREEKGKTWFRKEIAEGKFTRSLTLPTPIDAQSVDAVDRNGVLTITLPKKAEAKAHKIAIKPGK